MCSRGSAMFLAGDEFCNTQFGNNNAYCQDNIISWLDWTRKEKYEEMFEFCKFMIHFRKNHPVLRGRTGQSGCGFPEVSIHNKTAWNSECTPDTRTIGVMFAGRTAYNDEDDIIYIGLNMYWEYQTIQLPSLPLGRRWRVVMNTEFKHTTETNYHKLTNWVGTDRINMCPRSVVIALVDKY
jgi:glycogen operon protein